MAALDFPALPAVNQQFPVTPIAGLPQYTWDGEKWTTVGAQISNAVPASALPLMDATPAVVGVTTKYAREDHIHPTDTTRADVNAVLLKVPQGLSTTEQTDIRKNVYAAPFDALAYNGMQINGSMEVSQELGTGTRSTNGYICDGWQQAVVGTAGISGGRAAGGVVGIPIPNYVYMNTTTAQASMGASDLVVLVHNGEGYRFARLNWGTAGAQPITIGFWCAHNPAGTYTGSIRNFDGSRSYAFTYTQNTGSTGEYKTVTIPGDTAGTWKTDNTIGLTLTFAMACGATNTAPAANTWYGAQYLAAPGQINGVAALNNAIRISGVVVLPGIEAPSAARSPFIMRPFDQELTICKRYWQKSYEYPVKPGTANSLSYVSFGGAIWTHYMGGSVIYPVEMRAAPTFNTYDYAGTIAKVTVVDIAGANTNNATQSGAAATTKLCYILMYGTGGVGQPSQVIAHWTADARL